ncbi:hypothetical protein E2C01_008619 [Portunus trituberculatus]|uniref:Uncharacterized protein n=1 Tax=Portunus trituberculatus TaxID=210409 RepID=A0A5B7D4X7_PORTR|nr:hypothetical protein [Portunus trituberculatus]
MPLDGAAGLCFHIIPSNISAIAWCTCGEGHKVSIAASGRRWWRCHLGLGPPGANRLHCFTDISPTNDFGGVGLKCFVIIGNS